MNKNEHHIYGPPGTGKTTSLVRNIQRASEARGHDAVLVCSHTKAAASELASRDIPVNPLNVGTMHALCYRKFTKPSIAETKFAEWNERHPSYAIKGVGRNLDDLGGDDVGGSSGDALLQEISGLRNRMTPKDNWRISVRGFYNKWEAWKREMGYIDFTDMIEFSVGGGPPAGIEVVFVDEAQDFSALQFEVVRQWLPDLDRAIFVGDDDQSIYGFSGADPENLISRDIPDTNRRVLTKSFRVPKNIHRVANALIHRCSRRIEKQYLPRDGDDGELAYSRSGDWKKPAAIVDGLEAEVAKEENQAASFMVLASCGYMLRPLMAELRTRGMAFHNPYRPANGAWNPLRFGERSTVNRLLSYTRETSRETTMSAPGWTWYDLDLWLGLVNSKGIIRHGMRKVITERATQPGKYTELGYNEWDEVFEVDALTAATQRKMSWLKSNAASGKRKSMELPLKMFARGGEAALRLKPKIIVGTIHSVKGGEADNVYLFPDLSLQGGEQWIRRGPPRDSILRCFYVGMTRAKQKLTLLQPADGAIFVE